jgi:hypothetical protein
MCGSGTEADGTERRGREGAPSGTGYENIAGAIDRQRCGGGICLTAQQGAEHQDSGAVNLSHPGIGTGYGKVVGGSELAEALIACTVFAKPLFLYNSAFLPVKQ